jgi:hypothetical protein
VIDDDQSEPYADVKILAILAAITLVIFILAVIGAGDVVRAVHSWFT